MSDAAGPAPGVSRRRPRRHRVLGRLLRGGLLAAAVAAVVALDVGAVPLPYSTPVPVVTPRSPAVLGDTGQAPADEAAAERARTDAVTAALATMTTAYAAGDEAGFLSVVDPAETAFRARMTRTYRNLKRIGYRDVGFGWSAADAASAPAGVRNDDLGLRARPVVAAVEVRTRVAGFDRAPSVSVLPLTFAERAGSWQAVGDRDVSGSSPISYDVDAEPWMVASVVVERRPHVLVVGDTAHAADARRLATRLETAVGVTRAVWGVKSWNGKVVAYAVTTKSFVDHHFAGRAATGRTTKEAVFDAKVAMLHASAVRSDVALPAVSVPRMVVTPYLLGQDTAESRAVLRHELTHVAFAFEGGDAAPAWLVEGSAEYTGYRTGGSAVDGVGALARRGLPRQTWTELRRGTWKPRLVADPSDFYSGSATQVSAAYTAAWLTCLYLADTAGEQTLVKLYAFAGAAPADLDPEAVEAAMLKQVLKTDRATLLTEVRRYAKRIRGRFV